MEPITRKEKILAGEDIQPITRLEYFLKECVGGGGGGSSLPSYDSGDAGKVLTVADDGSLEWSFKQGGGGDFTTAEVTFVISGDVNGMMFASAIDTIDDFLYGGIPLQAHTYQVVLYKNCLEAIVWDMGNNSPFPEEKMSVSGDIEIDGDGALIITGNGTVTFAE